MSKKIEGVECGSVCCAIGWLPLYDSRVKWCAHEGGDLYLTATGIGNVDYSSTGIVLYSTVASKVFNMCPEDAACLN